MSAAPAMGRPGADDAENPVPAVLDLEGTGDLGEPGPIGEPISEEDELATVTDLATGEFTEPPPRVQHGPRERNRARELFERLSQLPPEKEERLRIRSELVELHLPLVEYLARRFRNRGEWLDDLTQVATIGLIKSIDRFDLERGVEFSTYATPTIVGEI